MAVEGEGSAAGKLVVGGGILSVSFRLASVVVVVAFVSSSNFFTFNCAPPPPPPPLLILHINYRRGQDTTRGTKFKLNRNNNFKSIGVRDRSPFGLVGTSNN